MSEEGNEIGRFVFGIRVFLQEDGVEYQTQSMNNGVPPETVIMQLRAFLNKMEKEYFDEFEQSTK